MREREYLVGNITNLASLTDLRDLDRAISLHLERYEVVSVCVCGDCGKKILHKPLACVLKHNSNNPLMMTTLQIKSKNIICIATRGLL